MARKLGKVMALSHGGKAGAPYPFAYMPGTMGEISRLWAVGQQVDPIALN